MNFSFNWTFLSFNKTLTVSDVAVMCSDGVEWSRLHQPVLPGGHDGRQPGAVGQLDLC